MTMALALPLANPGAGATPQRFPGREPDPGAVGGPVAPDAELRLTRRGRLVVAAVFAVAVVAGMTAWPMSTSAPAAVSAAPAAADGAAAAGAATISYTVEDGDSLWGIATGLVGEGDPRPMVERLRVVNGLAGSELTVGQVLLLPADPAD